MFPDHAGINFGLVRHNLNPLFFDVPAIPVRRLPTENPPISPASKPAFILEVIISNSSWDIAARIEWQGFKYLIDPNPAIAVCLAGRLRVGSKDGEKRPRLDYKDLYYRTEAEIAAAIGFGDSDEVVHILRKVVPDACKPHDLTNLAGLIANPVTRKALLDAEIITHPALLLLRNPYLGPHLTGRFLSDFASAFPHSLDILTCPWGPLLRGGGKGDEFTWRYQQAIDVVQSDPDAIIESLKDLKVKHAAIFMPPVLSYGGMTP